MVAWDVCVCVCNGSAERRDWTWTSTRRARVRMACEQGPGQCAASVNHNHNTLISTTTLDHYTQSPHTNTVATRVTAAASDTASCPPVLHLWPPTSPVICCPSLAPPYPSSSTRIRQAQHERHSVFHPASSPLEQTLAREKHHVRRPSQQPWRPAAPVCFDRPQAESRRRW